MMLHGHQFCLARKEIKSQREQPGQPESTSFWISDLSRARMQKAVFKRTTELAQGSKMKTLPRNREITHYLWLVGKKSPMSVFSWLERQNLCIIPDLLFFCWRWWWFFVFFF